MSVKSVARKDSKNLFENMSDFQMILQDADFIFSCFVKN